jgi:hypothetical protein
MLTSLKNYGLIFNSLIGKDCDFVDKHNKSPCLNRFRRQQSWSQSVNNLNLSTKSEKTDRQELAEGKKSAGPDLQC